MRKELLILLAVLSLALMGCSNKSETVSGTSTGSQDQGVAQTSDGSQQAAQSNNLMVTTLFDAEKSLSSDKLKKGERVAVSTPLKMMNVGDVYTFGVGIKNIYPNPKNFRLKPVLDDAKSTGLANLIHTDDTIEGWLARNRFETFTLQSGEEKVVPFIVEVGPEVAAGGKTVPGSYTFDVAFEIETTPRFWDKYNEGQDPLVIKVK